MRKKVVKTRSKGATRVHLGKHDPELEYLMSRVALRDRDGFRVLYKRTSAKLFGVSLRILGNKSEAEDALQDIYIKVWQRAGSFQPGMSQPMTWLITIARNHCIDMIRARKPLTGDLDQAETLPDKNTTPEEAAINSSEGERISQCLDQLDQDRAKAVQLAYVDGENYKDLAQRFAVPLNTMRTWLRRSLLQLRECLGQ